MSWAPALEAALAAWACVLTGATYVAASRARRFGMRPRPTQTIPGSDVLIVRPCAGVEPTLERTLRSTEGLLAPGACAVFAVADPSDTAMPVAVRVAHELRSKGHDVSVVVTSADAPNRKAAQLDHVARAHRDRSLLVSVDSDVDLCGRTLAEVIAPLVDAGVAAAWAPPVEAPVEPTSADRASAAVLGASLHAFPLLSGIDAQGLVGKLFVIRREALDAVGGFGDLAEVLGEDVELARRLAERNATVVVLPFVVRSLASGRDLGEVIGRFSRWLGVLRAQRPALLASYPLLFCATLPFAILSLVSHAHGGSFAPLALAVAARVGAAIAAAKTSEQPGLLAAIAWIPAADLVLLAAFVRALSTRRVVWRGRALVLGPHGRLDQAI